MIGDSPQPGGLPHLRRWYSHISSFENEFPSLPSDSSGIFGSFVPNSSDGVVPVHEPHVTDSETEDVDLFGSEEEEDDEAARAREQRLHEYQQRKAAKPPKPAAKTTVVMDVKPWDDETPMDELEAHVRSIEKDGLVWGRSKLVTVGFGIKKLQINLVVQDEKVSLDELQAEIEEDEEHVQSTDVAAMQKL